MAVEVSKGASGGSVGRSSALLSVDWMSLVVALGLALLVRLGLIGGVPW
jgi:hypothetical protein